jgi:hypothetical protein
MANKIPCTYCNTLNDPAAKTCVGCGAPLEAPAPQQTYPPQRIQQPLQSPPAQANRATSPFASTESQQLQDGAQQVEKLYAGATGALRTAWSVTGDAIAIAIVAFALGMIGGATGMGFLGIAGATLVGLIIGYAEQSFWLTILAAPVGTLIGIAVWGLAWLAGAGPKGMVFTATGLACIGALIGSRRRTTPMGCGGTVRPVLGAFGGICVSLVGLAIGLAIRAIFK